MKSFIGILSILLYFNSTAQIPSADSLKIVEEQLRQSNRDTSRVELLRRLGSYYLVSDPETAKKYFREGLDLARELNFKKGEADCLRWTSNALARQGQYLEALDNFLKGLRISESIQDSAGISASFGHIGNVYVEQGDYDRARNYYYKAKKIDELTHNNFELALMYMNIGRSHHLQKRNDSALYFFDRAYELTYKNDLRFWRARLSSLYGQVEYERGNIDTAMHYFRESIFFGEKNNEYFILSDSYLGVASHFKKTGQVDSSIYYGQHSLASAQKVKYVKGIMAASRFLSEAYEGVDKDQSFKYYKIAMDAKDSLYNIEKVRQIQNLGFAEQQRLQSVEDAKAEYWNKIRFYVLFAILAVFLVFGLILIRNNRNKQKANRILTEQKEEIQKTLAELKATQAQLIQSEKMASLGELTAGIAHEIQNPLNFVNNFSEVNKELLDELNAKIDNGNPDEIKILTGEIISNENKITEHGKRAEAIVKSMLQHSRISTGQKEPTDINLLVNEYLRLAYHGLRAKNKSFNATMQTDFDDNVGKVPVVPQELGRVLFNLINNAFYSVSEKKKFEVLEATNGNYEPTVSVTTKKNGNKVEITVRDNGIGITDKIRDKIFQPFFTTKPAGQGTGLGLSLSYDIITKGHGGEIKVESKAMSGATFTVILPS